MLISAIIPVYNTIDYLSKCVESIEDQDFNDFEIVMVDDGSTDGSSDLCDKLARKYDNIRVFHQANSGVSAARNLAIEKAQGDFLIFIDSDDTISQGYFSFIREKKSFDAICFGVKDKFSSTEPKGLSDIVSINCFNHAVWGYAFRKDLILRAGTQFDCSLKIAEDLCFAFCVLLHANNNILLTNKIFYRYTNRSSSAIHSQFTTAHLKMHLRSLSILVSEIRSTENGADCIIYEKFVAGLMRYYYFYMIKMHLNNDILHEVSQSAKSFYEKSNFSFFTFWRVFASYPAVGMVAAALYVKIKGIINRAF